jgi:hypothetical protein
VEYNTYGTFNRAAGSAELRGLASGPGAAEAIKLGTRKLDLMHR